MLRKRKSFVTHPVSSAFAPKRSISKAAACTRNSFDIRWIKFEAEMTATLENILRRFGAGPCCLPHRMLLPQRCRKDAFALFKDLYQYRKGQQAQMAQSQEEFKAPHSQGLLSRPLSAFWARVPSLVLTTWNGRLGKTFLDTEPNTCNPMRSVTRTKWWTAS